ncbi:beta-propeller domain-containing protein [Leptolyngbya sp. 15MV]|nr:beta-propeller domain-containing protein [Leptolyngbya sp. 15MV]
MSRTAIAWLACLLASLAAVPGHARQPGGVVIIDFDELGQVEQVAPQEPIAVDRGKRSERPRAIPSFADRRYRRFASPELTTFASDSEFRRYLAEVRRIARISEAAPKSAEREILIAATQDPIEIQEVCTLPEDCPQEESSVMVTGARLAATPSITNNQIAAVDEGDIVKRIGDYLLVLQDGRIFAVHFPTMLLTDRIDVYRRDSDGDPRGADWYDEMLVQDDQVIVTAYSYQDDASEISVFRLDTVRGRLEARGVFLISSDDYYDVDNYATRIVGDKLVIYTPYEADQLESRTNRPTIRRWEPAEDFADGRRGGRPVLEASDIYRPVEGISDPWVHTISICPLGRVAERGLQCRSTGFVAAAGAEMFVSERHVYLWTTAASDSDYSWHDCEPGAARPGLADAPPGAVFRVPLEGDGAAVIGVRGAPFDQFGMSDAGGRFRALANIYTLACDSWSRPREVALLDVASQRFGDLYRPANARDFTALPQVPGSAVENRFTCRREGAGSRREIGSSERQYRIRAGYRKVRSVPPAG